MSLDKEIEEKLKELDSNEDLEEMSVTGNLDGGAGPPKTPFAFQGKSKKNKKKRMKSATDSTGYSLAENLKEENNMSTYRKMMDVMHLNEITYKEYKADESMSPKKKVNKAISEVNRKLYEIEKTVNRNIKLKTETGVDAGQYWKSTKSKMLKISERMVRISNKLKQLGS
tara:strand:- start:2 stop:511 length:510 start_codon:yes stop_codon:yes gene_type:complete